VKRRLTALALTVALAACGGGGPRTFHTNSPIQALAKAEAGWSCELNEGGHGWRTADVSTLGGYASLEERGVDPVVIKVEFRCTEGGKS
jgi:hypothetical protein